jgi:hypothetical protein
MESFHDASGFYYLKRTAFVTGSLLFCVCVVVSASLLAKKEGNSVYHFDEFTISGSGILSVQHNSAEYLLVPREKYPWAELRGIAAIDLDEKVYLARFFEPGGVGVEGFFDVCFQLKNGELLTGRVENAGSLERINGSTYVRSCSYVFDSDKRMLLKIDSAHNEQTQVSLVDRPKPYSESTE